MNQTEIIFCQTLDKVKKSKSTPKSFDSWPTERQEQWRENRRNSVRKCRSQNSEKKIEQDRNWRNKNRERVRASQRKWKESNRDKHNEINRKWRENNPEKAKTLIRNWSKNNTEKIKQNRKKWRKLNPGAGKDTYRKWCLENRCKRIASEAKRKSLKYSNSTPIQIKEAKDFIIESRKIPIHACPYCSKVFITSEMQFDHIHPISKGGSHSRENLIISCASCNSSKKARILFEEWTPPKPSAALMFRIFTPPTKDDE
jgi:5-methylcytosine-specific restriction endonuclease McrA